LVEVVTVLRQAYPKIQNHIAGHSDIAPKRKTDPGLYFDWQLFRQLLSKKLRRIYDFTTKSILTFITITLFKR
jgi:N-acetyl-anhydromuramyl-L-alanine amidase AmpD